MPGREVREVTPNEVFVRLIDDRTAVVFGDHEDLEIFGKEATDVAPGFVRYATATLGAVAQAQTVRDGVAGRVVRLTNES